MKNMSFIHVFVFAGALLFVGAGCAPQTIEPVSIEESMEQTTTTEQAPEESMEQATTTEEMGETTEEESRTTTTEELPVDEKAMEKDAMHIPEPVAPGEPTQPKEETPVAKELPAAPSAIVFNLTGKNFDFSQKNITVKKGDTVTVNFTSESGTHDWRVDEFGAGTSIVTTGNSTSVTFVADKTGTFEYYCSVGSHRALGMVGTLTVQ